MRRRRLRSPGGRLTGEQLRVIASCSVDFGRDVADVTDRQNIQLHWIEIESVPAIRVIRSLGSSSTLARSSSISSRGGCTGTRSGSGE